MNFAAERFDQGRLRTDPEYLARTVCESFQQSDTYHRGMITAAAFSRTLEHLGLRYGQPEVEAILHHCTITNDGYVHYKDLLRSIQPDTPRGKRSTAGSAIYPEHEVGAQPAEGAETTAEDIRKVYALWDRGQLNDQQFQDELRGLGVAVNRELEQLLKVHGPSRNLAFGKLLSVLQIEECDGRRSRITYLGQAAPVVSAGSSSSSGRGRQHVAAAENPVNWGTAVAVGRGGSSAELRQVICDYIDGRTMSPAFRRHLLEKGSVISPEVERLIRLHDSHNSASFQDFARAILRGQSDGDGYRRAEAPYAAPLGAPAPYASGGAWSLGRPATALGDGQVGKGGVPFGTDADLAVFRPSLVPTRGMGACRPCDPRPW